MTHNTMLMEFDQVAYTYPCSPQPALQGISWQIPQGKRCAVIGQNGCGKTTLFRLANGLYRPQRGVVRFSGEPLRYNRQALSQLRRQVGLVFQNPEQQLVATTVEEDLSYGLCNLGLAAREIEPRVQQTLQDFELTPLADYPVNYLSLGQKKRVAIADVMILQPTLLFLDEPTAFLDPKQTRSLRQLLDRIQATGTTIMIATHDLNFVYDWADWVFVMNHGQLIMENTPEDVFCQRHTLEDLGLGTPILVDVLDAIAHHTDDQGMINQRTIQASLRGLNQGIPSENV
ncbi:ABC transporter ATP-binding protein [Spirulina sp. CS-785/01]|uniref:energy-coupling factor ABC transporter ATP-binding protein n=1 Tax=Spirulina sp. CS-785/01 TaxID=3021716 RepID=UPI00232F8800|nr:ABC transporter ATP-binding protein [Spirulina sp. CS-785/01]MDB9314980.1 ABC transporter ATP-binding protein [Spirulina sp. CS-785/01]